VIPVPVLAHLRLGEGNPLLSDATALREQLVKIAQDAGAELPDDLTVSVSTAQELDARSSFERVPAGQVLAELFETVAEPTPPRLTVAYGPGGLLVLPAVLGWSNGADGTAGWENLQLYGLDNGPSPRWEKPGGRIVERALRERDGGSEGDRFLVVRLPGGRRTTDEDLVAAVGAVVHALSPAETAEELDTPPTTVAEAEARLRAIQDRATEHAQVDGHALELAHHQLQALLEADRG